MDSCSLQMGPLYSLHGALGVIVLDMAGNIEYVVCSFALLMFQLGRPTTGL